MDVIRDYGNISLYLIGLPLSVLIIAQYAGKFPDILEQLKQDNVIQMDEEKWNKYKLSINLIFRKPVFFWTPYFVSIIVTIFLVLFYSYRANTFPVWYSPIVRGGIHFGAFLQIPVYLITYYLFSLCLVNIVSIYLALKKLFTYSRVSVQPLHPDNCGGLAPLGALSRKLNFGILLIGVIIGLNIYKNQPCLQATNYLHPSHCWLL